MRGVVFTGNSTLALVQVDDPTPGPADVVIEIKASGLCGSDLKLYRPAPGAAFKALGLKDSGKPIIAGHELCGVIAAVGSAVPRHSASPATGSWFTIMAAATPVRTAGPVGRRCASRGRSCMAASLC